MDHGRGNWIIFDSLEFSKNLFISLRANDPFELILRRVFSEVLGKLMLYARCTHGLHLFANVIDPSDGENFLIEADLLCIHPDLQISLREALRARHKQSSLPIGEISASGYTPHYVHREAAGSDGRRLHNALGESLQESRHLLPVLCSSSQWINVANFLNNACAQGDAGADTFDLSAGECIVVALSEPTFKLPAGRLGVIVLWESQREDLPRSEQSKKKMSESFIVAAKTLCQFVGRLIESHYGVALETYLPSYRRGSRTIGIMFADIRDFTPATEIARNFNLLNEFTEFIATYCREMCEIIQFYGGRIHSLAGDGIMALFGENTAESVAVRSSVEAARKMCVRFEKIKSEYLERPKIKTFLEQENEPMSFRLGIGINFGSVFFDYFGAPGSRVYSPFGDHVNFAQRLESEAARFDERLHERPDRMRAPILLSRSAWLKAGLGETKEAALALRVKGKPYSYPAYEVWPEP